jgi:hypothetical protein
MFSWLKSGPRQQTPLRLMAQTPEDIMSLSALLQDAVIRKDHIHYDPKARNLTLRLNRFCHEIKSLTPLRAQAVLQINAVLSVTSRALEAHETLSLLALNCQMLDPPSALFAFVFAGDGDMGLRLEVEAIDILMMDVNAPYRARSKPNH